MHSSTGILEMDLSVEARVWNRAALESGGADPREGDRALAGLLSVHGLVMNGGVHHALEVLSPQEIRAARGGFQFFSLAPVGQLLDEAETLDEDVANQRYWALVPDDEAIERRFRAKFHQSPDAFAPIDR